MHPHVAELCLHPPRHLGHGPRHSCYLAPKQHPSPSLRSHAAAPKQRWQPATHTHTQLLPLVAQLPTSAADDILFSLLHFGRTPDELAPRAGLRTHLHATVVCTASGFSCSPPATSGRPAMQALPRAPCPTCMHVMLCITPCTAFPAAFPLALPLNFGCRVGLLTGSPAAQALLPPT
jgi:hypothetical protein